MDQENCLKKHFNYSIGNYIIIIIIIIIIILLRNSM